MLKIEMADAICPRPPRTHTTLSNKQVKKYDLEFSKSNKIICLIKEYIEENLCSRKRVVSMSVWVGVEQ